MNRIAASTAQYFQMAIYRNTVINHNQFYEKHTLYTNRNKYIDIIHLKSMLNISFKKT